MTHMWKQKEEYFIDMPEMRIEDVYQKNNRYPIWPYLKVHNPKITDFRFAKRCPGSVVTVEFPKYPDSHPYFTNEDVQKLLETYMNYANMSMEEIREWYGQLRGQETS